MDSNGSYNGMIDADSRRCAIYGGLIKGHTSTRALYVVGKYHKISGVNIQGNTGQYALETTGSTERLIIDGILVGGSDAAHQNGKGVVLKGARNQLSNSIIEDCSDTAGYHLEIAGNHNLAQGNSIYSSLGSGGAMGLYVSGTDSTLIGNDVEGTKSQSGGVQISLLSSARAIRGNYDGERAIGNEVTVEKISQVDITDADATPSVSLGSFFKAANTGATTITNFDNGTEGQKIIIHSTNTNTTIAHNVNIHNQSGVNISMAVNTSRQYIYNGTYWMEL
jgi:hypothetical protein